MPDTYEELVEWYSKRRKKYEAMTQAVKGVIETMLRQMDVHVFGVMARTKTLESFREKIQRKRYEKPTEATDLSGIRSVTYRDRDLDIVCKLVRSAFLDSSMTDKSIELGIDRFGYRSLHLTCSMGSKRTALPEFAPFTDMDFEVQICTILQHAWAEITHDKVYKFPGQLSFDLKRRFNLMAGVLELADHELDGLVTEVAKYGRELEEEITDITIRNYLAKKMKELPYSRVRLEPVSDAVLGEMARFGLKNLYDVSRLFSQTYLLRMGVRGRPLTICYEPL